MEAIDAGDIPLEQVINELLTPRGLSHLVGYGAAACFTLARTALVPQLFDRLIANVDAIDNTTRDNIAFIVFHGRSSSFEREEYRPEGYRRLRYEVPGLSVSTEEVRRRERPTRTTRSRPSFDNELMMRIRSGALENRAGLARATEFATSILMKRFDIAESELPCLIFADKDSLDASLIVPISPESPIESLYTDVLTPISDAFGRLERFWEHQARMAQLTALRDHAQQRLQSYVQDRAQRAKALDDAKAQLEALGQSDADAARTVALRSEQLHLTDLCDAFRQCDTPEERIALIKNHGGDVAAAVAALDQLRLLENEKKGIDWQSLDDAGRRKQSQLSTSVNRLRSQVSDIVGAHHAQARARLVHVAVELRSIAAPSAAELAVAKAVDNLQDLEKAKLNAEKTLQTETSSKFDEQKAALEQHRRSLEADGFDQGSLASQRQGRTMAVLRSLARSNVLRPKRTPARRPAKTLKILFLAANPFDTSSLDLEEELRAIQLELRGAKHRDRIQFVTEHAVRPDDLVRHLRTVNPDLVHFSGHGTRAGIVLRDDDGGARQVRRDALARLFGGRNVKLLVLNACFSDHQAQALSGAVRTVVGTTDTVGDEAARRFSVAFYRALADGHSIADAFRDGGDAIDLHDLEDVYRLVGEADTVMVG